MTFSVPAHVRVANVDGDLVFLDARDNRYSCLARSGAAVLLAGAADDPGATAIREALAGEGLVCRETEGERWSPLARPAPRCDLYALAVDNLPVNPITLVKLLAAAIGGWARLAVPRPRRWLERSRGPSLAVAPVRAATLALQFDRLRPLLPRSAKCLASSIILLGYLRRHGIEADWVFGVRTFPFDAHCWVEFEGVILNDCVEHVAWFTPIAVS